MCISEKNGLIMLKIIGRNIRMQREKQYRTQAEMAELLGVSTPAISKIECGLTNVSLNRLRQIADVLDLTLQKIIYDDNDYGINEANLIELNRLRYLIQEKENQINHLRERLISLYEALREKNN